MTNTSQTLAPPADTEPAEVSRLVRAATAAACDFGDPDNAPLRARALTAIADAMDAAADELVPIAREETALADARLTSELARTTYQLRRFVEVVDEGSQFEATIDSADPDWALGPKPDLRRLLVGLGPVAVYSASNFPFAFSVAGGDTAAALAAGCPVIVKGHPGHPLLSQAVATIVSDQLDAVGAPAGTFALVLGLEAGKQLITEPGVKAGAFTGSAGAGRALFDAACGRPEPIPFYGELGSINPVFVTSAAVGARRDAIVEGFVASYTMGVGQFCTKPGFLFMPAGHDLSADLATAVRAVAPATMLNDRIASGFAEGISSLSSVNGVEVLVEGSVSGRDAGPTLLATDVTTLLANKDTLLEECFGPTAILVTYADEKELLAAASAFTGNLTATVHAEEHEAAGLADLLFLLRERAGRLLWNGWPTGVAVTWAMQHGGPYPATTASLFTSVGQSSIRRFLRPVSYQGMPDAALPKVLRREGAPSIVRREDGRLVLP
jgi:NADP-dependent aldehyde dehydrogenase